MDTCFFMKLITLGNPITFLRFSKVINTPDFVASLRKRSFQDTVEKSVSFFLNVDKLKPAWMFCWFKWSLTFSWVSWDSEKPVLWTFFQEMSGLHWSCVCIHLTTACTPWMWVTGSLLGGAAGKGFTLNKRGTEPFSTGESHDGRNRQKSV